MPLHLRLTSRLAFTDWKIEHRILTIKSVKRWIHYLVFDLYLYLHDHLQKRIAKQMFAYLSGSDDEGKRDVAIIKVREDLNQKGNVI